MKKKETYFVVFENGEFVNEDSFELALAIPHRKYLILQQPHTEHTTSFSNHYVYYKYSIINELGKRDFISIGDYQCIELGPEERVYGANCQLKAKILDKNGNLNFLKFETIAGSGINILRKLIPELKRLSGLEETNVFSLEQKIVELEKTIDVQKNDNQILESRISQLRNENDSLRIILDNIKKQINQIG
ncbi:hypothetical protein [Flectobacillus longus]|uniref:hypothetical protein n=1 Tax=Flectobacillus longus TaxID=2984207 RepID=UPI0024B69D6A|nr:hypothetical protein [Flectobacillus longus]MDI9880877.1 hypothetical protein [Flectobacillus longus]